SGSSPRGLSRFFTVGFFGAGFFFLGPTTSLPNSSSFGGSSGPASTISGCAGPGSFFGSTAGFGDLTAMVVPWRWPVGASLYQTSTNAIFFSPPRVIARGYLPYIRVDATTFDRGSSLGKGAVFFTAGATAAAGGIVSGFVEFGPGLASGFF